MKIYLRSSGDLVEQAKVYIECFGGKINKQSAKVEHAFLDNNAQNTVAKYDFVYLHLNHDAKVMLAKHSSSMPRQGYQSDIVVECPSHDNFMTIYRKLKSSQYFRLDYDIQKYPEWKTSLVKFYDKWGYGWILEVKN